jgi:hypothetical protein
MQITIKTSPLETPAFHRFFHQHESAEDLKLIPATEERSTGGPNTTFTEVVIYLTATKQVFDLAKMIYDWLKERNTKEVEITRTLPGQNLTIKITDEMTPEEIQKLLSPDADEA